MLMGCVVEAALVIIAARWEAWLVNKLDRRVGDERDCDGDGPRRGRDARWG